ncbi:MAG: TlyA family RNA methyltransferase [Christensenellales bacterium]|jgi:23S rRNA (cytidine1920-2'-O)/16S rRNA (cytidine1409-2'-O)-methyltransferase|nr:TlyA family RNA methyltransferase [Clostridiales bacterium]
MKKRADVLLVEQGLIDSRQKAQRLIMGGRVYLGEIMITKPSETIEESQTLTIRGEENPFVSRGGYKLQKAMEVFKVDAQNLVCMDIGAATGGFTDVLLRAGAQHIYAIDVGYGQLDWKLRNDSRVTVMERTNARNLTKEMFDLQPQLTVMDVSFISIRLLLPVLADIMGDKGRVLSLIKPQFEAGREQVGKNGVVRNQQIHQEVLREIIQFCVGFGWNVAGMTYSPIRGPKGNIEFLADIRPGEETIFSNDDIHQLVMQAHQQL